MGGRHRHSEGLAPRLCEALFARVAERNKQQQQEQQQHSDARGTEGRPSGAGRGADAAAGKQREAGAAVEPFRAIVEMSFLEVYNEQIRDLLNPAPDSMAQGSLRVREHPSLGVYVQSLSKILVSSYYEVRHLMAEGLRSRHIAATALNESSSRSHSILTLEVTQTEPAVRSRSACIAAAPRPSTLTRVHGTQKCRIAMASSAAATAATAATGRRQP